MESFNKTLDRYRALLREVGNGQLRLANTDFDTGRPTSSGEYLLADRAYGKLLRDLSKKGFNRITAELRQNLLEFYRNPKPPANG